VLVNILDLLNDLLTLSQVAALKACQQPFIFLIHAIVPVFCLPVVFFLSGLSFRIKFRLHSDLYSLSVKLLQNLVALKLVLASKLDVTAAFADA
jgi:hypothetical protein